MRPGDFEDADRVLAYIYRSRDESVLGPPFRKFVSLPLLTLLPAGIAPTLLTVAGHVAVWAGFAWSVAVARGPLAAWAGSGWAYAVPAAAIAFYMVADNIDGPQARRLGVSGPLGDFIDHWLDTLAGFLVPLGAFVAYAADLRLAAASVAGLGLAWWAGTAERWATGELRLPRFSEMESNASFLGAHLAAALFGPGIWSRPIFGLRPIDGLAILVVAITVPLAIDAGRRFRAGWSLAGLGTSLVPLAVWYALSSALSLPAATSVLAPLIFGMAAAVHVGELLRRCLIGTRPLPYDPALVAAGVAMAGSLLLPQGRAPAAATVIAWLGSAAIGCRLAVQFAATVRYMTARLGIGVFEIRPGASRPTRRA